MTDGLIRIKDPNQPIYRIFPLWFFEEALRLRQLVLVPPHRWDDPFEVLASSIGMVNQRTGEQKSLEFFIVPAYAQCWSKTEESDSLLRAYSRVTKDPHFNRNTEPRFEGVRVRSTPQKLIRAAQSWASGLPGVSCHLGEVRYGTKEQVQQYAADLIGRNGPTAVGRGSLRADLLLLKRQAFRHEDEVRLICVDERPTGREELIRIPVDPNELFDEVAFDPRLEPFERMEREAVTKGLGYAGSFHKWDLYQKTIPLVLLPNGWNSAA